jgi:Superfamily II DNA/RNA helicases, SNF2 family
MRVRGIVAGEDAELIAVTPVGRDAARVVYNRPSSANPEVRMLMRANEPQLIEIEEQPVPFDADPAEFLLAAQALWIRKEARSSISDEGPCQPLPHQLEAVYRHMLPQIPLRFLLADDPGAGKTIMAGLYLRELTLRSDLQRCLIVAPGSLVEQWRQEMYEKFSLEFTLLDQAMIDQVKLNPDVLKRPLRLIARMDQLARQDDVVAAFARATWDVVVVDEAHRMSARFGTGGEVKATKRYQLGVALREASHHFLLMTATPHAGKEEEFQLFMRLVDPDRFEGRYRPGVHGTGADGLWLRRTKEELVTLDGRRLFPKRAAYTVKYELSPEEAELYEAVRAYVSEEFDRADTLDDRQQRSNVGFAMTVLQRRLASSPRAIEESLRRRLERLKETLAGAKAPTRLPKADSDEVAQEYAAAEREEVEELVVTGASAARTPDELRREIAVVEQLVAQAERARQSRTDRKWYELRNLLQKNTTIVDADGNIRKIIIFTEHRDTLDYLVERCRELLGDRGVVASIHGGHSQEQRRATQRRFTADPQCRILIATDAAGEGLNLQVAHLMVNYDLPWNPNRLEQRFGRIHRIGQTEMCHLWNLVASRTREGAVYTRLLEKLETMREALQGKVFDVLGEVFEETPLHELLLEAIRRGDDPEVRRYLETVIDERIAEVARRLAEQHALSPEVHRPPAHTEYRRQVQLARARKLQPHYIRQFFHEAFERIGGRLVKREPGRWEIPQVPPRVRDFSRGTVREVRVPRVCFDPAHRQIDGAPDAYLLAPGERLFEAVRGYVEHTYESALTRGTVLVDPADSGDRIRLLAAIENEIVDSVGSEGRSVDRRFDIVEIDEDGKLCGRGARFIDYAAATPEQRTAVAELVNRPWLQRADRTAAEWATGAELPHWYALVNERRREQVARARQLVTERLEKEIAYWEEKAPEYAERGQPTRPWTEVDRLRATLTRRLAEFEAQEHLQPKPPRVVAMAVVVPRGLLDRVMGLTPIDTTVVEQRAMQAVLAAERALGRDPTPAEPNNPGYDITSVDPPTDELLFIEVKGRVAGAATFHITKNEILHAQNTGPQYRLALVEVSPEGPEHDVVRYVANPFDELGITNIVRSMEISWASMWARGQDPF